MWSAAKIASIFILLGVAALSGLFPRMIRRCLEGKLGTSQFIKRIPGALNCFSGGIFFAVVILDLLPESREDMEYVIDQRNIDIDFPLSECVLGIGFLFVLLLEHVALKFISNRSANEDNLNSKNDEMSSRRDCQMSNTSGNVSTSVEIVDITFLQDESAVQSGQQSELVQANGEKYVRQVANTETVSVSTISKAETGPEQRQMKDTDNPVNDTSSPLETIGHTDDADEKKQRTLRNYVLLFILTVHMFFDGIPIGLSKKESLIWQLLLAQCIHKSLVFLTIGIQVQQMYPSMIKVGIIIIYFAMVSPISVIVGALISSIDDEVKHKIVSSVLMSFSAGNFLFITFFEILQRELANHHYDLLKVFSTFFGFASFALLRYFVQD